MRTGARTPEELEMLLEDAFVTRDHGSVAGLFEDWAVLIAGDGSPEARGHEEIGRATAAIWQADRAYLADPLRVLQARDSALVIAKHAVNVARRGPDGAWRYAITLIDINHTAERDDHDRKHD